VPAKASSAAPWTFMPRSGAGFAITRY
jgi:hypothetical protein